jgi:hypothetical protein
MNSSLNVKSKYSILSFAWRLYRTYAATSPLQKANIIKWQLIVLICAFLGATIGIISSQRFLLTDFFPNVIGIASAILIKLSVYFSKEFIKPQRERTWVQARSLAEAIKSESYKYATQFSPYNREDAAEKLSVRLQELKSQFKLNTVSFR